MHKECGTKHIQKLFTNLFVLVSSFTFCIHRVSGRWLMIFYSFFQHLVLGFGTKAKPLLSFYMEFEF